MKSWKTTLAGALGALGTWMQNQADPAWLPFVGQILLGASMFLIGAFSRDNNVSSEKAGAK